MTATPIVAGTEPALLDRWGRPCPIADALDRFDSCGFECVAAGRKMETYHLVHTIARKLGELVDRMETVNHTLEAMDEKLGGSTDHDAARALIEVVSSYHTQTANRAFELGGMVMAALERGGMVGASASASARTEKAHG
ncbi:hypothetical protein [Pseudaquabacterium pictum]|uniref:Uncharacterized protein n=1 Tax=Pseudaquabacterium pictum TaxID=2315236 RepID=A0A480B1Q4_9BURK|nr:hypothetical protein [Rubrivivax pictus]GCL64938.1 hypothetical protein AQPW35_40190 [Rubrivivax pictus]